MTPHSIFGTPGFLNRHQLELLITIWIQLCGKLVEQIFFRSWSFHGWSTLQLSQISWKNRDLSVLDISSRLCLLLSFHLRYTHLGITSYWKEVNPKPSYLDLPRLRNRHPSLPFEALNHHLWHFSEKTSQRTQWKDQPNRWRGFSCTVCILGQHRSLSRRTCELWLRCKFWIYCHPFRRSSSQRALGTFKQRGMGGFCLFRFSRTWGRRASVVCLNLWSISKPRKQVDHLNCT